MGVAMIYGVSDVADAAGGWCGSVCGWSVACVRGGRWLVPVALSGRVCSRWCGLLVMLLMRVVQAMPRVVSCVRVVLVAPVVWVLLVTAWWMAPCGCFGGEGVVDDGSARVSSPPLAGAWWFVGSPVVVALVFSGGESCRW